LCRWNIPTDTKTEDPRPKTEDRRPKTQPDTRPETKD
jgi:hypothetical protein